MDEPGKDDGLPEDLIPLRKAAMLTFEHVFKRVAAVDNETAWSVVAQALRDLSPIYTYDEAKKKARQLSSFELSGSKVADGGRKLTFQDKRPSLDRVAIKAEDMRKVIQTLIESGISFASIEEHHSANGPRKNEGTA